MKLDDRDIVAQPSYEPLSNAELLAHIETYAGLIYDMPLAERGQWLDDIVGPARVLLARVAELEAQLAAQGWRPVTDDEPEEAAEVELLAVGYRDGGNWYYHDDNPVRGWRPLPPAPDTQEATTP